MPERLSCIRVVRQMIIYDGDSDRIIWVKFILTVADTYGIGTSAYVAVLDMPECRKAWHPSTANMKESQNSLQ